MDAGGSAGPILARTLRCWCRFSRFHSLPCSPGALHHQVFNVLFFFFSTHIKRFKLDKAKSLRAGHGRLWVRGLVPK